VISTLGQTYEKILGYPEVSSIDPLSQTVQPEHVTDGRSRGLDDVITGTCYGI